MNTIDLDSNCRICLKESETFMKPMSTKWINNSIASTNIILNFNEMLNNIITIDLNDNLVKPYNICQKCELNLIDTYSFVNICRNTEEILEKFIASQQDEDDYQQQQQLESPSMLLKIESSVYKNDNNSIDEYVDHIQNIIWNNEQTKECESKFMSIDDNVEQKQPKNELLNNVPDNLNTKEVKKRLKLSSNKKLCRGCKLSFESIKDYQNHYRTMHREKILCPLCGKLVAKFTLDKHNICHTKTKNHLCNECGKSFTLRENLKKHWRIHTGEKRYECEYCDEKFVHWNSKRSHVRTMHTGEKR